MFMNKLAVQCMAFFLLVTLSGCSYFIETFTNESYDVVDLGDKDFGIVFSHNVAGETHPCGCRHFPLGGLPQVAGVLEKIKKDQTVVYVDSGDTLFDGNKIADSLKKSKSYNAKKLAQGLSDVGLRYWLPGDQDFAQGIDFIKEALKDTKITPIIFNLNNKKSLVHKEIVVFEKGPHKIFLTGLVGLNTMSTENKKHFVPVTKELPRLQKELKTKGYEKDNKFHRLVVMHHAGISRDVELAKKAPFIDWIIGAHTMNFLRFAQNEGDTKIVQVLSRNHYMGHITIAMDKDKSKDSYKIHEVRDELKDELKPNPYLSFIDNHKKELSKIQIIEQDEMLARDLGVIRYATNSSCMDCHDKQSKFWQGTSHSLAYQTLRIAKEENNLTCVKCHSLGLNEPKGFNRVQDMLEFDKSAHRNELKADGGKELTKKYWSQLQAAFGKIESVRKLSSDKKRELATVWSKHDTEFNVNRNFANVQCLNCHTKHYNHPFEKFDPPKPKAQRMAHMKQNCIECHNSDQSPEWYQKQDNGLPGALDEQKFQKAKEEVACPRMD